MKLDFSTLKVLLIGDFMLDHYITGTSTRMSPEAPVPVVVPEKSSFVPGGAGNVAMNLSSLGANVSCVGYVGNDQDGLDLVASLKKDNINCRNIHVLPNVRTTSKTRFISNDAQIMRLDVEDKLECLWKPYSIKDLECHKYDIIILSDYNKGVLNNEWFSEIKGDNIFVDPKKNDFSYYSNANIITPNLNELQRATTIEIKDDESLVKACRQLIRDCNLTYIVAKKGDKGMTIVGDNNFVKHIQPHKVKNSDVTGAGDTVISALSLAYTNTNDIEYSAKIANAAAAIAVSRYGTNTVNLDDLNSIKI